MDISVTLVDISDNWVVLQYEDEEGFIQCKSIPRKLCGIVMRGPATVLSDVLNIGVDYSDVDLPLALGDKLGVIRVRQLQDALRREGIWRKEDYRTKSKVVFGVWQKLLGVDTATILNAALSPYKLGVEGGL